MHWDKLDQFMNLSELKMKAILQHTSLSTTTEPHIAISQLVSTPSRPQTAHMGLEIEASKNILPKPR